MRAPPTLYTDRLLLRRPLLADAEAIFSYASDPDVTRYVGWPRHRALADTQAFVAFSDDEWERDGVGPYLIVHDDRLIGGTGLDCESRDVAATGYVLARDAWGKGFATEALRAMVELGGRLGLRELRACCHPDHAKSQRVLEKGGFTLIDTVTCSAVFPQLPPAESTAMCRYACGLAGVASSGV